MTLIFDFVWARPIEFGDSKLKMYMVYYGVFIKSTFIGVGLITRQPETPTEELKLKMA